VRAVAGPERALLAGDHNGRIRVEVENDAGAFIDITLHLKVASISESVDQPVMGANVTLHAAKNGASLSPLRTDSPWNVSGLGPGYAPLIVLNRQVKIWEDITTVGGVFTNDHLIFWGRIDDFDEASNGLEIVLAMRDIGAIVLDRIIEVDRRYSTDTGEDVEVIMQQILDDNTAALGIIIMLTLPQGSPGWVITKFQQARVSTMDAVRALAHQIGWDVRFRWATGNTFELQLFEPDRAKVVADFTLPPSEYLTVDSVKWGNKDIRNVGRVWFYNKLAGGKLDYREYSDASSVALFGRLFIEIAEDKSSNIDTPAEALAMITAVINDLSTPLVDHLVTSRHLWFVQLGDLVSFPSNSVHYNSGQAFAVVQIERTFEANGARFVRLLTRGRPVGMYSEWIKKYGRGPTGRLLPNAVFGPPIGEGSGWGGVTGDGMVWLPFEFEPATKHFEVYAEEGLDDQVAVPDLTVITKAWTVYRQEGLWPNDDYWRGMLALATRPDYWKRLKAVAYDKDGVAGPEVIFPAVQARDTVNVLDGVVTDVTTITSPSVGSSTVDTTVIVDVGAVDPNIESWLMIMRNGIVIRTIFIGLGGNRVWSWIDKGVNPGTPYTYDAFIWTRGVSGARFRHNSGATPTPPVTDAAPVWDGPASVIHDTSGALVIRLGYKSNISWFSSMSLEESPDGVAPYVAIDNSLLANGAFYVDNPSLARFFRLHTTDGITDLYSTVLQWDGVLGPVLPADTIVFDQGTPRRSPLLLPRLLVHYAYNAAAADHVVLEGSLDTVNWTDEATDALTLQFLSADLSARYLRLRLEDAANATIAKSYVQYWAGTATPGVNDPPIITSVYSLLVAGVPTLRVQYTGGLAWFDVMTLQVSGDGVRNWTAAPGTGGNPLQTSYFDFDDPHAPVWLRVQAMDNSGTRFAWSQPYYWNGIATTPGGGAPAVAPTFIMQANSNPTSGASLDIYWTCNNTFAAQVSIERSLDDGATDPWTEVFRTTQVAFGLYRSGGALSPYDTFYYRMKSLNLVGTTIGTSASQLWDSSFYTG
jgi:hypothetical protein